MHFHHPLHYGAIVVFFQWVLVDRLPIDACRFGSLVFEEAEGDCSIVDEKDNLWECVSVNGYRVVVDRYARGADDHFR